MQYVIQLLETDKKILNEKIKNNENNTTLTRTSVQ